MPKFIHEIEPQEKKEKEAVIPCDILEYALNNAFPLILNKTGCVWLSSKTCI